VPRPLPVADVLTEPFWNAAREHRLAIQWCPQCELHQHPPQPICRRCANPELSYRDVSGRATLYTFTESHVPFVTGFEDDLPLVIGLVELVEPGTTPLRLLCNIERPADELRVGMTMQVTFQELPSPVVLPQFAPAGEEKRKDRNQCGLSE
jgi:uncharacterized OB-fold protein